MIYIFRLLDKPDHAAQAWLADEPFTRAGLHAGVEVHAFVKPRPQRAGLPPAT